ncbi:RNase P subunit p30-domain-containing protein [Phakopsora pachyrhizi]|uniref:RNase P subunit p30-domain-containing protein n=1 Tax=Phakopsora pachyrhizi TaxID=170000 RepID=A0AAV0AD78_PHAPC|nr:RNase P subunit p30-domain-containing protein [Phakopsora pachyrhizi]
MYVDLNITWPTSHLNHLLPINNQQNSSNSSKKKPSSSFNQNQSNNSSSSNITQRECQDVWRGISNEQKERLRDTVECSIRLGYRVIAFNLIVPQSLDPSSLSAHFPFRADEPPFPDLDPRRTDSSGRPGDDDHGNGTIEYGGKVLQLSRLTMVIDEDVCGGGKGVYGFSSSQSSYLSRYSILSVIPLDLQSFNYSCLNLSNPSPTGIDLISLDLTSSPKIPFHMSLSTVSKAMKDEVYFELNYGSLTMSNNQTTIYSTSSFPIIKSSTNTNSNSDNNNNRRNLISCVKDLVRVTKVGKKIVVSSGANQWNELRAGSDLINLLNVLGISNENCLRSITSSPKSIVSKTLITRKTYKGVIMSPKVVTSIERIKKADRVNDKCREVDNGCSKELDDCYLIDEEAIRGLESAEDEEENKSASSSKKQKLN